MLGIIRIVCIKKTAVEMRGPGPAFFLPVRNVTEKNLVLLVQWN